MSFAEIAKAALEYSKQTKRSYYSDSIRMPRLIKQFGNRQAEAIKLEEFEQWLNRTAQERGWALATKNRHIALVKLTYRLAEENQKIKVNPTRFLRMKKENNARTRFLNQFKPAPTKTDYLRDCTDEESRLRTVITTGFSHHLPEFECALHLGWRASEQYRCRWPDVDLDRRILTIPQTKYGPQRHIPLNTTVLSVLQFLRTSATGETDYVFLGAKGERLLSNRHWFPQAVKKAGVRDFTWHCLRHTFGSRLAAAGVDIRRIAELMGHQTLKMTMRYTHLAPSDLVDAVERLVSKPTATTGATSPESTLPGGSKAVH